MDSMCDGHRIDHFRRFRNPVLVWFHYRHNQTRSEAWQTEAADFQRRRRGFGPVIARPKENIVEDRHKIREWIRFACERNDVTELAQAFSVEWNPRFTLRLGDAHYSPTSMRGRIRLSVPLWPRASTEVRMETVVHETCHVIVGFKHGFVSRPHGAEWKQAMQNCGVNPIRLHSVDRTGLIRRRRLFILRDCPNEDIERKCRCTTREFNLLRKGTQMWCKLCGLHLHQNSSIEEDRGAGTVAS